MTQPVDRLQGSLEDIVSALVPRMSKAFAFYAFWEMTVLSALPPAPPSIPGVPSIFLTPATVTCVPTDPKIAALLPPQVTIPLRPSASGVLSLPTVGSKCLVGFANASPASPFIAFLDPTATPTLSLVGALQIFAGLPPLTVANLAANAAALLTQLETFG